MGLFDGKSNIPTTVLGMAQGFGDNLGRAALDPIMENFGYESEESRILEIVKGADMSSPESFTKTFQALLEINPEAASEFKTQGMALLEAHLKKEKIDADKAAKRKTAEAPAVFQQKINKIKAMNIPASEKADMIKKVLSGTPTQISIDQTTEDTYGKTVGKLQADKDVAIIDGAKKALRSLEKTNEVLSLLGQGKPQTGFGAEFLTDINRVLGKLGISPKAAKSASDTQLLNALLGSDVFPMIKQLGIGARGLDTPAEREFLREVMTGTPVLEGETLERMTKLRQKYMSGAITEYNNRLGNGELDRYQKASGISLSPIKIPKMYTPRPTNALELIIKATGEKVYKYPDNNIYTQDGKLFKKGAE